MRVLTNVIHTFFLCAKKRLFFITVISLTIYLNLFIVRLAIVHGPSMKPTIEDGSVVLVWQLPYIVKPGDIVILSSDTPFGTNVVKRVVAIGGQALSIDGNSIYLDENLIHEPYLYESDWGVDNSIVEVPAGFVFLLGDNRNASKDSRDFGCIPEDSIMGKVLFH